MNWIPILHIRLCLDGLDKTSLVFFVTWSWRQKAMDTLTSLTTTAILFYQPNIHLIEQNNSNFLIKDQKENILTTKNDGHTDIPHYHCHSFLHCQVGEQKNSNIVLFFYINISIQAMDTLTPLTTHYHRHSFFTSQTFT